jgi:uncharacterized protein YdhG (YjbR/CyaY superfamily)
MTHSPVDPDGLMEFSVVFTDRSLNHMSAKFQGFMRDISSMLKEVYSADHVAIVPGGGTYGMEAVARQFGNAAHAMIVRNGWFSFRWTQIFDAGQFAAKTTVFKARQTGNDTRAPFAPAPIEEVTAALRAHGPRLHRLGLYLGRYEEDRRRRADLGPAKGLVLDPGCRPRDVLGKRDAAHGRDHLQFLRPRPQEMALDHGGL